MTDRDTSIAEMFPEPIATYVDALASSGDHPVVAVAACLARYQEAGPLLREILKRAVDGKISTTSEDNQLFRTLHIVGGARDALAFPTLIRFLQGPPDEIEWFLGDADTETLPRIVTGVFDGNDDALFKAVANRQVPGTVRGALMRAAAFLTHEKRIDRQKMIACLERFARQEPTPGDGLAWFDWTEAIAELGLRHLEPLVSEAETRGWLDEAIFERDEFEKLLARAEQAPDDGARFAENHLGYLDDVLGALERFRTDDDGEEDEEDEWDGEEDPDDQVSTQPVINPWRHVGRNDPCPCGSGKKAKRCCLAA